MIDRIVTGLAAGMGIYVIGSVLKAFVSQDKSSPRHSRPTRILDRKGSHRQEGVREGFQGLVDTSAARVHEPSANECYVQCMNDGWDLKNEQVCRSACG